MTRASEQTPAAVLADAEILKVATARFGELEVAREKVLSMTSPFLGFPGSSRFVLLPHGPDSPFMWLQSLDEPQLAFVVIQPAVIKPDYAPALPSAAQRELVVEKGEKVDILVILTIPQGRPREMTANLLGPVMINVAKRMAKQVLLDPAVHEACWPVFGMKE